MKRYKLTLEYDGTGLVGWQRQKEGESVQGILEEAVKKFSGEEVNVAAAGRTDAGVHAMAQVAHFDLEKASSVEEVQGAINFHLKPNNIAITEIEEVDENFHARFSAKNRSYIYRILNRKPPSVLLKNRVWHVKETLDASAMHEAAQLLVGTNDLSSFRSAHCQAKSPIKTIDEIRIHKDGETIGMFIKAPSFLHNQVRIIIGNLRKVGNGEWTKDDLKAVLEAKDRTKAAETAPPQGLYFYKVDY